jgi:hypothetical protein
MSTGSLMSLYAQIDCAFPDRPDVAEVGDLAELVYYRSVLRCRDNLTDGVIDKRVISRWFAGIRGKHAQHLDRLAEVGLLQHHENGWCIPPSVWGKWNPTKAEVEAKRAAEAERVRAYREKKYARTHDVRTENVHSEYAQPEPEPEPEPEPITITPTTRKPNPVWDALVEHVGDVTTKPETSRRAKVVNDLRGVGATPEQIAQRCREYRRRWPTMDLTDTALLNHWSKLEAKTNERALNNGARMSRYA